MIDNDKINKVLIEFHQSMLKGSAQSAESWRRRLQRTYRLYMFPRDLAVLYIIASASVFIAGAILAVLASSSFMALAIAAGAILFGFLIIDQFAVHIDRHYRKDADRVLLAGLNKYHKS
ncbi:MAG: hypothetical protein KDH94_08035, partial [Coxiellaceae bacterium]|nr:hypothetical protein [Coxiellaceae bacterium]